MRTLCESQIQTTEKKTPATVTALKKMVDQWLNEANKEKRKYFYLKKGRPSDCHDEKVWPPMEEPIRQE